jgi:hypothetical protein
MQTKLALEFIASREKILYLRTEKVIYIISRIYAIKERKEIVLFSGISHFILNSSCHILYAGMMTIRSVERNNSSSVRYITYHIHLLVRANKTVCSTL